MHPSVPATTIAEFIALAKARPGKLNYASAGVGTSPQLSMELFKMTAGIDIVHIAYKGGGPALVDLIGGQVQAMFGTVPSFVGAISAGKIRVLGVTSTTRAPDLPDVPTIAESGMPGFEVISWQGSVHAGGSADSRRSRGFAPASPRSLALPDTRKRLADQGIQLTPLAPEKFAAFIRSERDEVGQAGEGRRHPAAIEWCLRFWARRGGCSADGVVGRSRKSITECG